MTVNFKRFDDKYIPEPNNGCWLWTSGWDRDGYGVSTGNKRAHRISYEMHVGKIPEGMIVCHKCDTPACVNPAHLFVGTHKENAIDRDAKGRGCAGEVNVNSKLTAREARQIINSTEGRLLLAARYGVSYSLIAHIQQRRAWRHVS